MSLTRNAQLFLGVSTFAILAANGAAAADADNQQSLSESCEVLPEQVLVTGSLIRGSTAVVEPARNLGAAGFVETGALKTADLSQTAQYLRPLSPR